MTEIVTPFAQFFDTNGAPLNNGAIFIGTAYLDAQTNPIPVYWDDALTIPALQPIRTLNGYPVWNGAPARIFCNADNFSMTVQTSTGRTVWAVQDATSDIPSISGPNGSSQVGFIQDGAGAVARTAQAKMRDVVSVKDFGAVGNGVTDDTPVFSNMEARADNFFYLPEGTYVVNSLALKKTYWGPGIIRLNGTNRPQILANDRPPAVVVFPPVPNASNVLLPDGTWLNTASSTTSGLQEAINYACGNGTAGSGNFDLHIVGAEEKGPIYTPGGAVVYICTSPISFPPMQGKRITSGAVTIFFTTAIGTQSAVRFDSCMMVDVYFAGAQIVNGGTGRTLEFSPQNNVPLDGSLFGIRSVIDSRFLIQAVVNINNSVQAGGNGACVYFNPGQPSGTGINNNHFEFGEINQQNTAANTAGIWVTNATATQPFANNFIKCLHVHNHRGVGAQIGVSSAITNYGNNYWHLIFNASAGASEDCNTFGNDDTLIISSETLNQQYGLLLQSTASGNLVISNRLNGSVGRVANFATDKTSNRWVRAAGLVRSAITPGGSPFTYQNTDLTDQIVLVQGGVLTAETQFSVDGSAFYNVGLTGGQFTLPPGTYLRVTYSSAPQMNVFKP